MSVIAVIPVKPMEGALGRLAGVLDPRERRDLQAAMLSDVLGACATSRGVEVTLVVTNDPEAGALAREHDAAVVSDHVPPAGMNAATERGMLVAEALGASATLVLTADLPLAQGEDLDAVIAAAPGGKGVAVASSLDGTGTNALLLAPPRALRPQLGPASLARHLDQASARALPVGLVDRPRLALDIDTPGDLAMLCGTPRACSAWRVCDRLGLARRVAAVGAS